MNYKNSINNLDPTLREPYQERQETSICLEK